MLLWMYPFECIWMYLDVFIDIIIRISPSYSHCNVFAMRTYVHICFSLPTMTTFLTCYTTTLFSPIPIDLFQLSYNLWKNYISILTFHIYTSPHIPHPTFYIPHSMSSLVVRSITKPKFVIWCNLGLKFDKIIMLEQYLNMLQFIRCTTFIIEFLL
jgi:hypothetical protein